MTKIYEIKCFTDDKLNGYAQRITSDIVSDKAKMPFLYSHSGVYPFFSAGMRRTPANKGWCAFPDVVFRDLRNG